MADNTTVYNDPLANYTVADDDVGGAKFQRIKLDIGGDGVSSPVTTANPLPVDLASSDSVEVTQATHDDLNCNSNIQVGDVDVANGNPVPISDAGGSITVDGAVAATQSGTWNINDVSGTVSLPTGAATAANQLPDGHNVTIDNASGAAAVNIQDGGNSITVDGTVDIGAGSATIGVVDQGAHKTSGQGWRTTEYGTTGLPNFYSNILGVFEVPVCSVADPVLGTVQGVESSGGARVAGTQDDDVADSGSPVKVGGRATDMEPNTTGVQGPTAVGDGDRKNLVTDLQGRVGVYPNAQYETLTTLEDTYDNTTTTNTSSAVECHLYRQATVSMFIQKANTPTTIQISVEQSLDNGTNWAQLMNGPLGSWIYDDVVVGASGIRRQLTFPIAGHSIRVVITAVGTTASNTFTVSEARLYLRS